MGKCVACGWENAEAGAFCAKCGRPLAAATVPGKCPQCGALNALDMRKCGACGASLPEVKREPPKPKPPTAICKWCGREVAFGEEVCWDCQRRQSDTSFGVLKKKVSSNLSVAGILLIVAGALAILQAFYMLVAQSIVVNAGYDALSSITCCSTLDALLGLGSIAGGYFALKRLSYGLSLAGCLCAIIGFGAVIGSILGIVALVLISSCKDEF